MYYISAEEERQTNRICHFAAIQERPQVRLGSSRLLQSKSARGGYGQRDVQEQGATSPHIEQQKRRQILYADRLHIQYDK